MRLLIVGNKWELASIVRKGRGVEEQCEQGAEPPSPKKTVKNIRKL